MGPRGWGDFVPVTHHTEATRKEQCFKGGAPPSARSVTSTPALPLLSPLPALPPRADAKQLIDNPSVPVSGSWQELPQTWPSAGAHSTMVGM